MEDEEKYHSVVNVSIDEAIERCVKVYGIEGTEDTIKRVYTQPSLKRLKKMFLETLYKKYKLDKS